jgi:hypothetical protein
MASSLKNVPSDFGEKYLHFPPSLKQHIQGRKYCKEAYVQNVVIDNDNITALKLGWKYK